MREFLDLRGLTDGQAIAALRRSTPPTATPRRAKAALAPMMMPAPMPVVAFDLAATAVATAAMVELARNVRPRATPKPAPGAAAAIAARHKGHRSQRRLAELRGMFGSAVPY